MPSVIGSSAALPVEPAAAASAAVRGDGRMGRWMTNSTPIDSSGTPATAASAESGVASASAAPLRESARAVSRSSRLQPGHTEPSMLAYTAHPSFVASAFSKENHAASSTSQLGVSRVKAKSRRKPTVPATGVDDGVASA